MHWLHFSFDRPWWLLLLVLLPAIWIMGCRVDAAVKRGCGNRACGSGSRTIFPGDYIDNVVKM